MCGARPAGHAGGYCERVPGAGVRVRIGRRTGLAATAAVATIIVIAALQASLAAASPTLSLSAGMVAAPGSGTAITHIRGAGATTGAARAIFRLTTVDDTGTAQAGLFVALSASDGATVTPSSGVTDSAGQFEAAVEGPVAASGVTATVTAQVLTLEGGTSMLHSVSATVQFGGAPTTCTLTANASSSSVAVAVTVADAAGNAVPDQTAVAFSLFEHDPAQTVWLDDVIVVSTVTATTAGGAASATLAGSSTGGTVFATAGGAVCSAALGEPGAGATALAVPVSPSPAATSTPAAPAADSAPPSLPPSAPPPAPGQHLVLVYSGRAAIEAAALIDALPFPVASMLRYSRELRRYELYLPGAPAQVNTLTSIVDGDVLLVVRAR